MSRSFPIPSHTRTHTQTYSHGQHSHTYQHTHTDMHVHTQTYSHRHTHIHTNTHTGISTYRNTHTHTLNSKLCRHERHFWKELLLGAPGGTASQRTFLGTQTATCLDRVKTPRGMLYSSLGGPPSSAPEAPIRPAGRSERGPQGWVRCPCAHR